jgi:hypothetical protein
LDTPPPGKPTPAGSDVDAAGRAWKPSRARLALALALVLAVAGCTALLLLLTPGWQSSAAPTVLAARLTQPAPPAPAAPAAHAQARSATLPVPDGDNTRDLSSYIARGDNPPMADVIERLHQRGIYTGLGAFSPPGTSPPLVGLAVPEDFPLPKGYVRHHQATDDGQAIEAILMFAPDYQPLDANHQPIDIPGNRVVPPHLAPPGLPIRRIVIPASSAPDAPSR